MIETSATVEWTADDELALEDATSQRIVLEANFKALLMEPETGPEAAQQFGELRSEIKSLNGTCLRLTARRVDALMHQAGVNSTHLADVLLYEQKTFNTSR